MAAFALNVTGYYGMAASMFALPDGPLLFFWLLTVDRLSVALEDPDAHRLRPWIEVGLAWGGAMLSKYHAVFIPLGAALYVLLDGRMRRRWLFRPGPFVALAMGLIVFSPVIIWNAQHGWVSFLFQGGRAVGSWVPRPDSLLLALLARGGVSAAVVGFWSGSWWRPFDPVEERQESPERLSLCLALVPLGVFTGRVLPSGLSSHWGLIGLVSLCRSWDGVGPQDLKIILRLQARRDSPPMPA
jgi:4-amino-4-deoxy-L-arabinose transferase-like glycosyltransferase